MASDVSPAWLVCGNNLHVLHQEPTLFQVRSVHYHIHLALQTRELGFVSNFRLKIKTQACKHLNNRLMAVL